MGVDIAVRKKPQEMQGGVPILYVGDQRAPRVGGKHFAGLDGLADQLGALRKNLTGTEGVVPDLGVPHVVIRRQTDGCSVCLEFNHGIGRHQTVQRGRVRLCDGVAGGVRRQSDAVHDQCQDRAPDALKIGKMFQLFHTEEFLSFRRHQPRGIALPLYYTHFCRKKQEVSGNFAWWFAAEMRRCGDTLGAFRQEAGGKYVPLHASGVPAEGRMGRKRLGKLTIVRHICRIAIKLFHFLLTFSGCCGIIGRNFTISEI